MSISKRRLSYVLQNTTQTLVSKITGIPQSTISRVKNGQIPLPSKYTSTLRSFYQRTAYADLRAFGASSIQARRFAWYIPETVTDILDTLEETKNMLTTHWVALRTVEEGRVFTPEELILEKESAEQSILEAMRKSKKSIEDIYSSGKKTMVTEVEE